MEDSLKMSVIIPVYNGSDYLGEAIESVLNQSYQNFEIIVVDDASTEVITDVLGHFGDPRIKYLYQETNAGANVARNTGIKASSGEIIAFLDQDDYFHPDKLLAHSKYFSEHPEIGFTYNSRFNLNHSSKTIREIWQPPDPMSLADLVLGFPLSPSDMVVRRNWLDRAGYWDETQNFNGAEITLAGRLYLSGCRFACIRKALNFRRYYSGRRFSNLSIRCNSEIEAQEKVLSDPRCPVEVRALRNHAFANSYLIWAYTAFAQEETGLGQEFIQEAVRLAPSLLDGNPNAIIDLFIFNSVVDDQLDHEVLLRRLVSQFPSEIGELSAQLEWAISYGYLIKGARAFIWNRPVDARRYFRCAKERNAELDERFLQDLIHQLLCYEQEFGDEATNLIIGNLLPDLQDLGGDQEIKYFMGNFLINRAFEKYGNEIYSGVPGNVLRAIGYCPKLLGNRGVLSILWRSIVRQ